ncbi:MAG: divalent-cation tolerance protein CutA [Pseudomonadota bacterium]
MTEAILLYATAPDAECAQRISEKLVEDELAACVNVLPTMHTVYRWRGEVESAEETPVLVKTTSGAAAAARDAIIEAHPYDCPCVLALPIRGDLSSSAFLDWIGSATKS